MVKRIYHSNHGNSPAILTLMENSDGRHIRWLGTHALSKRGQTKPWSGLMILQSSVGTLEGHSEVGVYLASFEAARFQQYCINPLRELN